MKDVVVATTAVQVPKRQLLVEGNSQSTEVTDCNSTL